MPNLRPPFAASVILVLTLAAGTPALGAPETTTKPTGAPVATSTIPDLASDPEFLARCKAAAAYSAEHDGQGILVMLNGKVVYEEAQGDWPLSRAHPLASGTKSFSGVAAALALKDKLITLDERVADTITEWKNDPQKSQITVRQVLTLSAGFDPQMDELKAFKDRKPSGITDHAKRAIEAPLVAKPGEKFIYTSASFYVFGELMKRKLIAANTGDADIVAYMERKVFKPLGINPVFARDAAGNANLPGGCRLSAKEWATFGELIRNKGKHNDKQILDPEILAQLFIPSERNPSYGLTWWLLSTRGNPEDAMVRDEISRRGEVGPVRERLRERMRERRDRENAAKAERAAEEVGAAEKYGLDQLGVMAAGLGKQRLYILPEFKLTVVRFGDLRSMAKFEDADFLRTLIVGDEDGEKQPASSTSASSRSTK